MPEITLFQCITKLIVTCAQQNKYGGIANVYQIFSKIGLFRHFKEKKLFGGCGSHTGRGAFSVYSWRDWGTGNGSGSGNRP